MTDTLLPAARDAPHPLRPRRVSFDYGGTPTHWIPGDPHTTHVINVLHLLLPAGERWFCDVYRHALPHITDDALRHDVKAFIGQEATHARAHDVVLRHLDANGIDPKPFTSLVDRGFHLARPRPAPSGLPRPVRTWLEQQALLNRLAAIAAIEHFTAALGWWILAGRGLDDAGADPEMLALLRWHGAEEVEHRSVAFDAYVDAGGGYVRRSAAMVVIVTGLLALWVLGTRFLLRRDATITTGRWPSPKRFRRAARQRRLPRLAGIALAVPRYLAPRYHPSREGRTEIAIAYLAAAPGLTKA